jgi:hypothetical protein
LLAQHAEQMQRVGIIRRGLQVRAIRLFGGVELAGLVEVEGFLQGHDPRKRQPRADARAHIMPQPPTRRLGTIAIILIAKIP